MCNIINRLELRIQQSSRTSVFCSPLKKKIKISLIDIISTVRCSTLGIHHHGNGHALVTSADAGGEGVGDCGGGNGCGGGAIEWGHTAAAVHVGVVLRWCDGWRPEAAMLPAAVAAYTIA